MERIQIQTEVSCLAVIPARGGSKRVPRKNVLPLAGKPLIAWTIEAALAAQCVDRVIVSTDSPEIAETSRQFGALVPFMRPDELCRDETPGIEPIIHAACWLEEHEGFRPDWTMLLQPTSPFRTAQDIDAAVRFAEERNADSAVSVCVTHHHPCWMKSIDAAGRLSDFLPTSDHYKRQQDLPPIYVLNGALYLVRRDVLLKRRTFYSDDTVGYVMPEERSLDIDTPWDMHVAELIMRAR